MATPVIMPKLEMAQETSTVVEWLKQEGQRVEKGEPLLTVETDKVTVDIESPASGILADIRVEPQQVVPVTQTIAYILEPGEALPEEQATQRRDRSETRPPEESEAPTSTQAPAPPDATPVARRLAEAGGVDLSAVEGTGPGGRVTKADVELALSADQELAGEDAARSTWKKAPALEPAPERVRATPAARRIARERGTDLAHVPGTGPRGRVQAADVLAFEPTAAAQVVPLKGMRRTIAERMTASYRTTPHIALTVRVDMGAFEEARAQLNARAEATDHPRVSVTTLLVKATAWALRRHPWLNSTLQDGEIRLLPQVNIGVAVALQQGLIVPVVREADRKGVAEIATRIENLANRAREGSLTPADVAEGTFTLSNLGPFGVEQFTAIINPPQAAILAVGAVQPEVVPGDGGRTVVRPMMRMTLSVDHRIVDGAVAARFLDSLRKALQAPALLLW